jgi:HAE1 family hydrophobic/amphiphilic exporter-1
MALPISSWAIKRPLIPIVIFVGLVVTGLMLFARLPVNGMPNVNIPVVNVSVFLPGASPTEIESQITTRVETAVAGIGGIKHITSTVNDSVSSTKIEFQLGTDINQVLSKVRDQMIGVRPLFPRGAEEPVIQSIDADVVPILTFAVESPQRSIEQASWLVDTKISRALLAVKGVAKVQRQGGVGREVRIELDPARLQSYGVTAATVNDQLVANIQNLPAGRIDSQSQETLVRTVGVPSDVDGLKNMSIALPNQRFVRLGDLGAIRDTTTALRQIARFDGKPVVGFAVYRAKTASEVDVEAQVDDVLKQIQTNNPDVKFLQTQTQVEFTKDTYHAALWSFIEGALLAAAVVFVFFRNWRATWITALGIPLSVIPTFLIMQWMGFSLNMVSLLALSLVSGVLVDDAIVEIENIMRHLRMGKSAYRAAMDAADEIGLAVVATTIVIVAVFVPVSFMGGVVGQYFIQFGLTVAIATIFSLFVARFITPVLAAYFLKPFDEVEVSSTWMQRYRSLLGKALAAPKQTVLLALGIMGLTVLMATYLPTDFMPFEDKSQSTLQVELPAGTRIEETDRVLMLITDALRKRPEVASVYTLAGGADVDTNIDGEVRRASVQIRLKPRAQRDVDVRAFEQGVLQDFTHIPNARIAVLNENGSKALTFSLASDDHQALIETANALESQMRQLPMLKEVSSTIPLPHNEFVITPRTEDAARLGVNTDAIAETGRVATLGDLNSNLARISLDGRQIPLRVQLNAGAKQDGSVIGQLLVPNSDGVMLPISAVADINFTAGPASILRYDRQRQMTLEANLQNATLGEGLQAIESLPALKNMPKSVQRFDTGDAELLGEMFDSFLMALVAGALIVLGVLVLLFRTVLQPITIMVALPLSIFGACLALWLTGASLSLPAVIGILMLTGIVGKNGILLVDCIIETIAAGKTRHDAILEAAQQRARPIVMTSMAMIAGMFPLVLGFGAGNAFREPMAIAVIGGLLASTALSLLFVPVVFVLIDDLEKWLTPKLRRLLTLE